MARKETKSILVRMSATLKRRLGREVARRESTLNDIAVQILAERYQLEFEPSGRKGSPPGDTGDVLLRVPPAVKQRLDEDSRERGISTNQLIVEALSERLLRRK
jgi:predicted HicB family RNase H-like nuclease